MYNCFGAWCAEHGYLTFIPEYTPIPETNLFGQIGDILKAFEAIDRLADNYDGDKSKMYLVGDGAGAALACLTYALIWHPVSMRHLDDELPFNIPQNAKFSFRAMCLQNGIFTLTDGKTAAITPYLMEKDWKKTSYAPYVSPKTSVASHLSGDLFVAIPGVSCIATFKDLLQVCKKNGICLVEAFDMDGKLLPKEVEKGQEGNHITVESAREK